MRGGEGKSGSDQEKNKGTCTVKASRNIATGESFIRRSESSDFESYTSIDKEIDAEP